MLKLMPMNIYDVAAQQARMEDQAARGWFAVSVPGIFFLAVFEKGEPKAVRYRLEPAPVKESCPDPERLAAYQSMGWEYVDTSGKSMHLWRCDDPDAPELHTDPETEAQAYDRLFRRQQKETQFWAAVTALLAVLAVQTLLTERTLLVWSVQEWKPLWREAAYWGFLLALALAAFRQWWSLRRYLRPLRAGVPVCHRPPYRLAADCPWRSCYCGEFTSHHSAPIWRTPDRGPLNRRRPLTSRSHISRKRDCRRSRPSTGTTGLPQTSGGPLSAWATGRRRTATASVSPGWRTIW